MTKHKDNKGATNSLHPLMSPLAGHSGIRVIGLIASVTGKSHDSWNVNFQLLILWYSLPLKPIQLFTEVFSVFLEPGTMREMKYRRTKEWNDRLVWPWLNCFIGFFLRWGWGGTADKLGFDQTWEGRRTPSDAETITVKLLFLLQGWSWFYSLHLELIYFGLSKEQRSRRALEICSAFPLINMFWLTNTNCCSSSFSSYTGAIFRLQSKSKSEPSKQQPKSLCVRSAEKLGLLSPKSVSYFYCSITKTGLCWPII